MLELNFKRIERTFSILACDREVADEEGSWFEELVHDTSSHNYQLCQLSYSCDQDIHAGYRSKTEKRIMGIDRNWKSTRAKEILPWKNVLCSTSVCKERLSFISLGITLKLDPALYDKFAKKPQSCVTTSWRALSITSLWTTSPPLSADIYSAETCYKRLRI